MCNHDFPGRALGIALVKRMLTPEGRLSEQDAPPSLRHSREEITDELATLP